MIISQIPVPLVKVLKKSLMYVIPPLIPKVFFQFIVLPRFPYLYSLFSSTWLDSNQRGAINSQDGFADRYLTTRPHVHSFVVPAGLEPATS